MLSVLAAALDGSGPAILPLDPDLPEPALARILESFAPAVLHTTTGTRSLHLPAASEAAAATRDYAFGTLRKTRVISLIRPENLPSQCVARKIGMTPEDRVVQHGGFPHLVFSLARQL